MFTIQYLTRFDKSFDSLPSSLQTPALYPPVLPAKQNNIMVKEVDAAVLKIVMDNWESLKQVENYEKVAGRKVMK